MKKIILGSLLFLALLMLAACGGSSTPSNALHVTTASPLTAAPANSAYSLTFAAAGGTAPYTWAVTAGTLPTGLTLSTAGVLSGTPTVVGTYTFTVTVTDSATPTAATATLACSLLVTTPAPLAITTTSPLTGGTVSSAYSLQFAATGGTSPYTWAVTVGTLPAGLTLSTAGLLSGTPTTAATSTFTVTVTDSATPTPNTASLACSLTIAAAGAGAPAAPTGVVVAGGTNSETITWPAVTGATSYNIYFDTAATVSPTTSTSVTVPQPTTAVTSPYKQSRLTTTPTWLAAGTTYFYVVTATNASGTSAPSTVASAATSATDGVLLYQNNCQSCHGVLQSSAKTGRTAAQIQAAINGNVGGMGSLSGLTTGQVQAIADVLVSGF